MARFIQIPETVTLTDPVTDEPLPEDLRPIWPWVRTWRTIVSVLASKGAHDALSLIDLRRKGEGLAQGQVFELTEEEFKMVEAEFRRPDPRFFGAAWIFSCESHQRALLDAPTKRPAALANGVTADAPPLLP